MRNLPRGHGLRGRDPSEISGWDQPAQLRSRNDPVPRWERGFAQNASTFREHQSAFASPDFAETQIAVQRGSAFKVSESTRGPDGFPQDLPRLRRRRKGLAPVAVAFLAFLLLAFGVVVLAAAQSEDMPVQTARLEVAPQPQWIDIIRPIEIFSLDAAEFPKDTKIYRARRHHEGGGRQDMLGFGQLRGKDPFLRLMVYRIGSEAAPQASFYVDLARRAAAAELSIGRSLQPQVNATRFGPVEVADLDLVEKQGPATPCLGFRSTAIDAPIKLVGFACGTAGRPLTRPGLVCVIERLDLNSAGGDPALARFFAESELKRNPVCAGIALGPKLVHVNWADQADAQPPLRPKKTH